MADKENSPPRKRAKYMCKFCDKIAQEYPDITRSKLGDVHAFCKVFKVDISIGNGGARSGPSSGQRCARILCVK